jgi:hypothetical protein
MVFPKNAQFLLHERIFTKYVPVFPIMTSGIILNKEMLGQKTFTRLLATHLKKTTFEPLMNQYSNERKLIGNKYECNDRKNSKNRLDKYFFVNPYFSSADTDRTHSVFDGVGWAGNQPKPNDCF